MASETEMLSRLCACLQDTIVSTPHPLLCLHPTHFSCKATESIKKYMDIVKCNLGGPLRSTEAKLCKIFDEMKKRCALVNLQYFERFEPKDAEKSNFPIKKIELIVNPENNSYITSGFTTWLSEA